MEQWSQYQYDVCFSFASEQVSYVEQVYECLQTFGIRVFFDRAPHIEAELWGSNLPEEFHKIYNEISKYCVMFISKEYGEKVWTRFERRSALERALMEEDVYILPVRFDDTELPGFHFAIKYIDANEKSPKELAALIAEKLGRLTDSSKEYDVTTIAEQLASELRSIFLKKCGQHIVQVDPLGRILIFRNKADEKEALFASIIEFDLKATQPAVLFNFGIFPSMEVMTRWKTEHLLEKFRSAFS